MLKNNCKTDKFTAHTYLETYEKLLDNRVDTIKNVLEVGVEYGGSMELWSQYIPNAHIYGVDLNPLPFDFDFKSDRMTHLLGDAYRVEFIRNNFNGVMFDLLIDDGSHRYDDMIFFAKHYSKLLAPSGILIIEDIPNIDWVKDIIFALPRELSTDFSLSTLKYEIVDNRHINNRWDDILLVVGNI